MGMNKLKKIAALGLVATMTASMVVGCGSKDKSSNGKGSVYFLNFKPEAAKTYEKIAKDYKDETGVTVKVVTAASGTYEEKLKSEISKSDAPTIFQVNGPVGYQNWKDYCADLKDTDFYKMLNNPSDAITSGDGVYGVPYAVEGYGIIYNNEIMSKYFALADRATTVKSTDEIKNYDTFKAVVEDMQKHKKDLGIEGVFASTSLSAGNQWRWQTHLANIPFDQEFIDSGKDSNDILAGLAMDEVEFKYADNFKNIFDLYTDNSTTKKGLLGGKSVDDSMAEFALGKAAMVQNGNWGWGQISQVDGNVVKEDQVKMMPIYTGIDGEDGRGICVGTENYLAINSKASKADQEASLAFLKWLFSSEKGKKYVINDLGFIVPFNTFSDSETPADPLAKEVFNWNKKTDVKSINWGFAAFPSEEFKNVFGDALLQYTQGNMKWEDAVKTVKDAWKTEKAK